jgi:hypothetical protein
MSEKKYYAVGATSPEGWEHVNEVLLQDGTLEDNIPARAVECTDLMEHSDTRAVYLLTDEEASQLANHPDVLFVQLNTIDYPEFPRPPSEDLTCARYTNPAKCYNDFTGLLPATPNSTDINRSGYQLLRCNQYASPWYGANASTVYSNTISNISSTASGLDVDVIVSDDGCWFGHVEFNYATGNGPTSYITGNKLPGNGTCGVLDLVLDSPYYIDPDYFDADPAARLITRWDGTKVPAENTAREWWGNASARSSKFSTIGTVTIPSYYTRANCNGDNTTKSIDGTHGTACSGLAFGRTYGWAYNSNKWFIDSIGTYGVWPVNRAFDIIKIFHQNKPINSKYGSKDPTICSNSWGFREAVPFTGYYYFRSGTSGSGGVAYTGTKPNFMYYIGYYGDGQRCKGEMVANNLTTSGDELIRSGVIMVVAAGNSNQKQVGSAHPDYNNYWSTSAATPLSSATHTALDNTSLCYNTTNRRGFPQQIGQYTANGVVNYPVINIGALDDNYQPDGKERKVDYSDMGEQIDCYAPADGTLTSNLYYATDYPRTDQYPGALTSYDCGFSGTSAACPVATGLIATKLQYNRTWTWKDIKAWLQTLTDQTATTFYQGPDPTTATSADWADVNSLMGGTRKVVYTTAQPTTTGTTSGTFTMGAGLSYKNIP